MRREFAWRRRGVDAAWVAARWLPRARTFVALPVVRPLCLPAMLATMTSFTLAGVRGGC